MIVRIYDFLSAEKPKFSENLVGIVSDVTKFKYTRRAYDIGSFEMEVPTHANDAEYIQPDRMLIVGEKLSETYISGDPTRRIVNGTFLYVTEVDKNDQTITVTGYDLKYLFASRVTLFPAEEQDKGTYGYYVVSGTTFSCISNLINYNIVNATDSDRQIFGMSAITMPTTQVDAGLTGIQDDRYMTRLEPLSTAIFNLLKNCKTHFYDVRLLIDDNADDADNYNPHLESSEDKPTIIIDESRYNIKSYTRKDGTSAYKNAIYAVSGTGDDVVVKCVKREGDTASGIKRKEVVLDVDTDSVSEIDRYAIKAAEDYNISDDFEIEPLFDDDDAEPTLAQKVLIRIDGVDYETVITEITDEYSGGKHTQSYVCGDKKLKVLNVLNKATAGNTQKIIDNKINIGNKGGVGAFTNTDKNCEIFNDYSENVAQSYYAHAEGSKTSATARYAHAEGYMTQAVAPSAHAEGYESKATNNYAHAEGKNTQATGYASHAEGEDTVASGWLSHAEGKNTVADGMYTHAGGMDSHSLGIATFAHGKGANADGDSSAVFGKYNATVNYPFVVGIGYADNNRIDGMALDWDGNMHIAGRITADGGFNIPIATSTTIGGVKIGENLTISEDGTLSANSGGYTLPVATADTLGGVKIGDNIAVADDGTISVDLSGYLKSADISDWAKQPEKPVYTASEVGAAAEQHKHNTADITDFPAIPTKVSELQNDSGYISEETDPTVPAWAKADTKPTYTASEVGAATVADIKAAVDGIEIGGRNLFLHTKEYDGTRYTGWASLSPTTSRAIAPYTYIDGFGVQRISTAWFDLSQVVPVETGTNYTLSAWIKWESEVGSLSFYAGEGTDGSPFISQDVSNQVGVDTFKRVSCTYNSGTSTLSTCRFECGTNTPFLIYGLKFEKGNQATDWSPAPEDSPDYIIIGGRNLLLDTSTPTSYTASETVSNQYITYNLPTPYFFSQRAVGKWVTVSFDYETTNASGKMMVNWNGTPWNFCGGSIALALTSANQKGRYVRTRQITQADVDMPATRSLSVVLVGFIGTVTVSNIQLEFSNTPSDWSPAPEDAERRITSLEARVAALEAAAVSGGE